MSAVPGRWRDRDRASNFTVTHPVDEVIAVTRLADDATRGFIDLLRRHPTAGPDRAECSDRGEVVDVNAGVNLDRIAVL